MKATAKDLRFSTKNLMDAVSRGEEVIITYRGKARAKMIPFKEEKEKSLEAHPLFGIWKDHKKLEDVQSYVRNQRKGRF